MRWMLLVLAISSTVFAAPMEVGVVRPIVREQVDGAEFVGRTEASQTIEIRSRVSGFLEKVHFEEGTSIKKGDLLYQLDDRNLKAEFDKAKANLLQAEAKLKLAEAELKRALKLRMLDSISQEDVERIQTELATAKASIAAVQAALEVAKLNLEATRIVAPISGRIGHTLVHAGNLIKAQETLLATLVVTDPMHVSFDLDEKGLLRLRGYLQDRKEEKVPISVRFESIPQKTYQATVNFVDTKLNTETGTIRVRAVMTDTKGELVPGLFARVSITMGPTRTTLSVPMSAVVRKESESHVLVVTEKKMLAERKVKLGPLVDNLWTIEEGLTADDTIVVQPRGRKVGDEVVPLLQKEVPAEKPRLDATHSRSLSDLPGTSRGLIVQASYPGANAQTIEDVLVAPIVEQLRGLDGVTQQFVECTSTGEMRITLLLKKNTDLNKALVDAQNRVALAQPALPDLVRRTGIVVKKRSTFLMTVAVRLTDDARDRDFLHAYADLQVREQLQRVNGVGEVSFLGETQPREEFRLILDRDRLAARGLTAAEVNAAVQEQVGSSRRQADAEKLGNMIVKTTKEGNSIRLRDVARIEAVVGHASTGRLDGKRCVLLQVSRLTDATADSTAKAVRGRLTELTKTAPVGIEMLVLDE